MTGLFPIDNEQRKIGSRACAIVHYFISADHWLYREDTEIDVGRDCILELSENNRWLNHKIECQIKGTRKPNKLKKENAFLYQLETKTIMYALGSSNAFVLFYVDINSETVYYLRIQDYFIANPCLFDRLEKNKKTLSIHIDCERKLTSDDNYLQQLAKNIYIDGLGRTIKSYRKGL